MPVNQIVKNIIKYLVFALPVVALVSPVNMFFPFITGKAFLFRVAVELAFHFGRYGLSDCGGGG